MVKKVVPENPPIVTENEQVKKKGGASRERMAELSKIAIESKKMNAKIKQFEKQKAKEQMKEKYQMIKQLEEQKNTPVSSVKEEQPTEHREASLATKTVEEQPPVEVQKVQKKKKIVEVEEVVEVEESDTDTDDEQEIVIKKVIKRIQRQKKPPSTEELYKLSTTDMLKQRLYNDRVKRVNNDLFDF